MGKAGQTFFGGSDQNSQQSSGSLGSQASGNLLLPWLTQALGSSVNYLPSGGNAVASLLGLPGYANAPVGAPAPVPAPLPTPAQVAPPVAAPVQSYRYVDLFHDGINGNGKQAQKSGQPTSYYVNGAGQPVTNPSQLGGSTGTPSLGANGMARTGLSASSSTDPYTSIINDSGMGPAIKPTSTPAVAPPVTPATPAATTTPAPATAGTAGQSALQNFSDSGGLKFLQDNANRMINNNQAAKGMLQSGSTLTGVEDYANGLDSQYLNQYLTQLQDYSKLGLGAAGVLSDAGKYSTGNDISNSTGSSSGSSKPGILNTLISNAKTAAAAGG